MKFAKLVITHLEPIPKPHKTKDKSVNDATIHDPRSSYEKNLIPFLRLDLTPNGSVGFSSARR